MRRGQLRTRVQFQQLIVGQDSIGQATQVWADVGRKVYADIKYLTGLEAVKADASVEVTRCSMQIEYLAGILPSMRAIQDGKFFDIKSVLPDPTGRRHLFLVCETGR